MKKTHSHVSIDYYAYISGLGNWNTVYKVIFSLGALITVIAANSVFISAATIIFMLYLNVVIGKIHGMDYLRLLWVPAAFILLGGIAIMIQFGSGAGSLFSIRFFWTRLYITTDNLRLSLNTALKAFAAISAFYMVTLSTPMGEIISVFRKVRVPGLILELMHLIYRYIFILSDTNRAQKEAAKSRNGYCDLKTSFRTFSGEIANLFVMSMKKADMYYDAMEARGYEGDCDFWEEKKALTGGQLVYGFLYGALLILIFFIERRS
ncbi:cobalt ECF transporter T component CbiQ [Anaerocolumna xylanovorans]|uniref:Cobalt/nickel transport system permease protein n=1 Tax=Anaerocolumna xylanovorans DSM 12503 TaxID=1121345 RepID=A0A1M7XYU0_9FIRM|nr:cobalt ECF transporter T component CbiQ [Anaerocolumna xylanovorans]SHO44226.1 cobalt/nickel transport system permease protein [Anaerocolumna xylanovorans DSM 12503]